jgi:subtilase family serine protease
MTRETTIREIMMRERMSRKNRAANARSGFRWLLVVAMSVMSGALLQAATVGGKVVAHNTPRYVATAKNLGAEDPAKTIEVSIWLQLHNQGQFDELTKSFYDASSPNYRHWLKAADIAARFGPTDEEAKTVRQFFTDHNLAIVKTGPSNFYVRARGTVGDVEKAFHVQLNNYQVSEKTMRANVRDPFVEGPAGDLTRAVSGLDTGEFEQQFIIRPTSLPTSRPATLVGAPAVAGVAQPGTVTSADLYSPQCFLGTEKVTFSENNDGEFPIGTYAGNTLNLESQTSPGCAYTPTMIQTAYNLTGLYNERKQYDGTDQTIAIIDWCGSYTILSDVNAFSAQYGLLQMSASGQQPVLGIIYTAPSFCIGYDNTEINLDVEWAHAVAPGANINLVVPPSASFQDVDAAEFEVVDTGLGTVLSGSYGSEEWGISTAELETESLIAEIGAAQGISTNYATGDYGDYTTRASVATVSAPADSPWATAVGGVSLALNANSTISWQAGWGTNWGIPAQMGTVTDPPGILGFEFGSGGGTSNCVYEDSNSNCTGGFPKPSFQAALPGSYRQVPDISWVADPYTGAAILISIPGLVPEQVWQVVGGTSLSTPMFSALWAIANQEAEFNGKPALGQAAQYLYSMSPGAIYDIVPVNSKHNVTASIEESTGTTVYDASAVLGGAASDSFISGIWNYPYEAFTAVVISFGSDCSDAAQTRLNDGTTCDSTAALTTQKGWDDVTGMGVPNAKAFADYFRNK